MIYTTTYHAHRKALGIKQDEYTMLHAIMLLQNLEKNGFWCVAPNEYFTTFMDAETIRGVQKIAKRLVDKGLLINGAGTRRRVSDEFVIGFNKFSKVQIGLHEQRSPMNSVHPKHEQSSPLTMNSVHVYHEQSSPNIERIEKDNKKIVKDISLDFAFDEFYNAYGKKVDKQKTIAEYKKLTADKRMALLKGAKIWADYYKAKGDHGTSYHLSPLRFITYGRYLEQPPTLQAKGNEQAQQVYKAPAQTKEVYRPSRKLNDEPQRI